MHNFVIDILRLHFCQILNPKWTVENYSAFFNRKTTVIRENISVMVCH